MFKPSKTGLLKVIHKAMVEAGITPGDIDFYNAHATSTYLGDEAEGLAIKSLLGDKRTHNDFEAFKNAKAADIREMKDIDTKNLKKATVSSFKGHMGHSLPSCSSIEIALGALSI